MRGHDDGCKTCRSRKMVESHYLLSNIGVDKAANEPSKLPRGSGIRRGMPEEMQILGPKRASLYMNFTLLGNFQNRREPTLWPTAATEDGGRSRKKCGKTQRARTTLRRIAAEFAPGSQWPARVATVPLKNWVIVVRQTRSAQKKASASTHPSRREVQQNVC